MKLILALTSILFVTSSCGWHLANNEENRGRLALTIPYVSGDSDGLMTQELVGQVERQGAFSFAQQGAPLELKVELLDSESSNIGFRYDPDKLADGKQKIIPNEVRRKILAKVTIIDTASQKVLLGPAHILGSIDFDHQYYNLSHNINNFSLGQLTDIDTTYDVVEIPLYRNLAQKIAIYLENNADLIEKNRRQ